MASVYEVDIRVGFEDGRVTTALSGLAEQMRKSGDAMQEMRKQGMALSKAFTQLFVGSEMMKWGHAGLSAIGGMVKAAGDLESAMMSVRAATGLSARAMADLSSFTQKLAGSHTFSTTEAALMETIVGKTTFKRADQIKDILGAPGGLADFADVMGPGGAKLMGIEEGARLGMQVVDIVAGGGNTSGVPAALDSFSRMIQSSGGTPPGELLNAFKAIAGTGMALGQDPTHMMQIAALTSLRGLGTRIPTALRNDLLSIDLARHGALVGDKSGKKAAAMREMGLLSGSSDIFDQLGKIGAYRATHGGGEAAIAGAFGDRRGPDSIFNLTSPQMAATTKLLRMEWERLPPLSKAHAERMETVNAQLRVLDTNFTNLAANIGFSVLPAANEFVKTFASVTAVLADFAKNHPLITGVGVTTVGGGAAAVWAGGAAVKAVGELALLKQLFTHGGLPVWVVNSATGLDGTVGKAIPGGLFAVGGFLTAVIPWVIAEVVAGFAAYGIADLIISRGTDKKREEYEKSHAAVMEQVKALNDNTHAIHKHGKAGVHAKGVLNAHLTSTGTRLLSSSTSNPSAGSAGYN